MTRKLVDIKHETEQKLRDDLMDALDGLGYETCPVCHKKRLTVYHTDPPGYFGDPHPRRESRICSECGYEYWEDSWETKNKDAGSYSWSKINEWGRRPIKANRRGMILPRQGWVEV